MCALARACMCACVCVEVCVCGSAYVCILSVCVSVFVCLCLCAQECRSVLVFVSVCPSVSFLRCRLVQQGLYSSEWANYSRGYIPSSLPTKMQRFCSSLHIHLIYTIVLEI